VGARNGARGPTSRMHGCRCEDSQGHTFVFRFFFSLFSVAGFYGFLFFSGLGFKFLGSGLGRKYNFALLALAPVFLVSPNTKSPCEP